MSVTGQHSKHDYTVILLYPDHVSSGDIETYCVDIKEALHPAHAVEQAQWQCLHDNGWVTEDDETEYAPEEFAPLYIFNGIAPDCTYTNYDRITGDSEVPVQACQHCGSGLWSESPTHRCRETKPKKTVRQFVAVHEHRHGVSAHPFQSQKTHTELSDGEGFDQLITALGIDFEPELLEQLSVVEWRGDEAPEV